MHRARGRFSAWTFVQASPASTTEMGAVGRVIGSLLLTDIEVESSARKHPLKQHF
jgi:hypothetical protein